MLLKTAWRYAGRQKIRFTWIYFLFILSNIIVALNPLFYGWFIGSVQRDGLRVLDYAWMYAGGFLGLKFLEWAFHGPARISERKLAFHISSNFLDEIYHQTLHLPVEWHQDNHSGSTINRLRKAYEALRNFFQNGFTHIYALGKFTFSFVAMIWFSPLFGFIGVVIGAFTVWIIYRFDKPYIQSLRECNEKEHQVYSTLFDSLSNIISVITLRLEKSMKLSLSAKVSDVFPAWKRRVTINEWKWFSAQMLVALVYAIVVVGYIHQQWEPGTAFYIGGLVTLLGYVNQFTSVFNDVAAQYTQIVQYHTDIQAVEGIRNEYTLRHRPENIHLLPRKWQKIEIESLDYHRSNVRVGERTGGNLHDIRLVLQKRRKIALIGESGGGKSTLMALLRGLYSPSRIHFFVDGKNGYHYNGIPNTTTLFPQDPEIFENTILYNITLGLPFEHDIVEHACKTAEFWEVVAALPGGLQSHIQEKGVNLSGGQKQRLALARGILASAGSEIILLDEPTSSVDPKTEQAIYERLLKAFSDKVVISSLHRLHLLPMFDYIYVLQNGKIADEGTFDLLLTRSKLFNELWRHQKDHASPAARENKESGSTVIAEG